ncbi:uncharacterized protein LOC126735022 [Anthonomus grandis grandis]|uniref:uncharacterized protein LOC126735022 n=1 Tax=Anthonomus grandis grandis TaxID=2921223 RepID=UPI002164F118|nr:uncharacterized protein LOC126735022 [Anthonomus grandis grandis]
MFATQACRLAPRAAQKVVQQTRNMSIVTAPPRVKISPAEKLMHGLAISVGCLFIPAWVLVNIKNYKGQA